MVHQFPSPPRLDRSGSSGPLLTKSTSTKAPMYIQYFCRNVLSGTGFTTSPCGVSGGGALSSGEGGVSGLLTKTVELRCRALSEKVLRPDEAFMLLFLDFVRGHEPSFGIGDTK